MSPKFDSVAKLGGAKIGASQWDASELNWVKMALGAYGISFASVSIAAPDFYPALERGVIDAVLLTKHPSPYLQNDIASGKVRLLPWSEQAVGAVTKTYPETMFAVLPPNTYKGQTGSILGYAPRSTAPLRPPQTTHVNMGWKEGGPVFGPQQVPPYPAVVQLNPGLFAMYYHTGSGVSWATSGDGVNWSDRGPINVSGAPPAGYYLGFPSVVFWREPVGAVWQEHFLMFVSAYATVGGVRHYDYILVLESSDGLNWSYKGTAFADDTPGADPAGNLRSLTVIRGDTGYEGWLNQGYAIYHTTSDDGVAWSTPQATSGLPDAVTRPTVVRLAGNYVAWYSYPLIAGDAPVTAIGLALSDDGVNWTPSPENPLFKVEADTWRSEITYAPWVVLDEPNGLWRLWFSGRTSHVQGSTEFLTLDPASPTDSPAPGRFAQGVSDPSSIVMQLRFPSSSQPVEGVPGINDDDGNTYAVASQEPTGKIIVGGWDSLNGGKPADQESLKVYYQQRIRDYRVGSAQAPTHILNDVVNKASWGDEIVVHPGVYLGQVYGDKAIRLRSSHGPALTFIDARQERRYGTEYGSYPAVRLNVAEGQWQQVPDWWLKQFGVPETRIEGFTISNANSQGVMLLLLPGDKAQLNPRGRVVNNVARGNGFADITAAGITVISSANDMRIESNQAYGNGGRGIRVSGSAWVGLFNNSAHDNGGEGILLLARDGGWSYAHVQDNQVQNNGGSGIYSSMNDGQLRDNAVTDNGGHGIHLEKNQGWSQMWANAISGNGGDGIHINRGHVGDNTISGNAGSGIIVEGDAWITGNTVSSNGQHGVLVGNWAEIRNNTISGNGGDGLRVGPGAASVLDNTIQNNSGKGVALVGGDGSRVAGNTIADNDDHGIFSDTSNNLISANQITNNKDGIWVEGDNNQILANTIQGNVSAASGIHLTASAEGNQVHYNNIAGNSTHGVFKEGLPPVDASNNWWGDPSGPSVAGPGTGDAVNENVLFAPWLSAAFSDTTPPVIDEALALPRSLALYATLDKTLGPSNTTLLARASDEHSGVVKAEVNLRPLAEMLTSDLQIPPERQAEWQSFLQWMEHWTWMWYDGTLWGQGFGLGWLVNEIGNRFSKWGMWGDAEFFKLRSGEAQVPVTVYDGAGNQVIANFALTIVDAMIPLNEGWNLRSLPVALDNDTWSSIVALGDGLAADVALRFNDSTQQWQTVADTDRWRPLDGVYIHTTERDHLSLIVGRSPTAPPLRNLDDGWALIGPAFVFENAMPVTQALRSLEVNAAGERGYLVATSPTQVLAYRQEFRYQLPDGTWRGYGSYDWRFQQDPWLYLSGDEWRGQMMIADGGNWVYMEHPDTLVGYSSTPLVAGVPPEASGLKPAQAPSSGPPPLPMVVSVSTGGSWSAITARVDSRIVGQVTSPGDTLLVQGDIATGALVSFYVDGVPADQRLAYESGKVTSVPLTTSARVADINADGTVNRLDLESVANRFNTVAPGDPADLNGDGVINIFDLAGVSIRFGVSLP